VGPLTLSSDSPTATRRIGARLGRHLRPGDVILLLGELGTGKTCFTQGIGRGLGIADQVKSSSFVLVNEYVGRLKLYQADLYRLEDPREVMDLALEETAADGVLAVEWPERAWEELPPEHLLVWLEWVDEHRRRLTLETRGQQYEELVRALSPRAKRPHAGATRGSTRLPDEQASLPRAESRNRSS
jgi:tRNA threonylcarbamoyladenosine biosynthesis protein TsaE